VSFHRRRLPHINNPGQPTFITWRLHGSLPPNRFFDDSLTAGQAFAVMDRLLEQTREGPFYLAQSTIAERVVEAIDYNAQTLSHYTLHAFVVMPNHVHLLVTPKVDLPKLTKSLKGITAKRANAILGLTGSPFWQDECYDHLVRNQQEFGRIKAYIEYNPVRACLVREPSQYRWSSASRIGAGTRTAATAV